MANSPRNTAADEPALHYIGVTETQRRAGNATGMALEQEASGQRQLVRSDVLPTKINGAYDFDIKEALTEIGFAFGDEVDGDPMFRSVQLPEGWTRKGSSHSLWSHVHDERGRERLSIFYKAAFYDRRAFFSVSPAIRIVVEEVGIENGVKITVHVKKCDELVFSTTPVESIGDVHSIYDCHDAERAKAIKWVEENYPDYKNPCAYWD